MLLAQDGVPKLTDFGLARITDEPSLSRAGDFAGSYFYMSPEQVAASRAGIDRRTDVFSLGVVLYELLTLRIPFDGDTPQQVSHAILFRRPAFPRDPVRSRVPEDLEVICLKALEKSPDDRFDSMAELEEELRRFLEGKPIRSRRPGHAARVMKWARRSPYRALAVGVLSVAAVVVVTLAWTLQEKANELTRRESRLDATNRSLSDKENELRATNEVRRERERSSTP